MRKSTCVCLPLPADLSEEEQREDGLVRGALRRAQVAAELLHDGVDLGRRLSRHDGGRALGDARLTLKSTSRESVKVNRRRGV